MIKYAGRIAQGHFVGEARRFHSTVAEDAKNISSSKHLVVLLRKVPRELRPLALLLKAGCATKANPVRHPRRINTDPKLRGWPPKLLDAGLAVPARKRPRNVALVALGRKGLEGNVTVAGNFLFNQKSDLFSRA